MNAWLRVIGLFVAIVIAALLLKVLPTFLVLALFIGGVAYANHLLTQKPKRQPTRTTAGLVGLRPDTEGEVQVLALPFALLARGSGATVRDMLAGARQGTDVKLFSLSYLPSMPPGVPVEERTFSCAIAGTAAICPHLIVEPRSLLTAEGDRAPLPEVRTEAASFDHAFDVRSSDEAFARELLDDATRSWLLDGERWGFELNGQLMLIYGPPVRQADLDLTLEAMDTLLARVASVAPSAPAAASETIPERPDHGGPAPSDA
jgi:hypothetical protein